MVAAAACSAFYVVSSSSYDFPSSFSASPWPNTSSTCASYLVSVTGVSLTRGKY